MIVAVAYLVVSGLVGSALLLTSHRKAAGATPTPPAPVTTAPAGPTAPSDTTSPPQTTVPSATGTSGPPSGYQQVSGPPGMTTVVPTGWPVRLLRAGVMIADDPADPGRFVELGGSAVSDADMLGAHLRYEHDFVPTHPGYTRLRLESATYHSFPAVDWEFEWVKSGVQRHAHILYWQTGGVEYFVYASSTAAGWGETETIYNSMVASSTP
jgi:hypothetical protein